MCWGFIDEESVDYYWIGIGEMEMYRMMELLNPRNFLQSGSPRCRSDQPACASEAGERESSFLLPSSSQANLVTPKTLPPELTSPHYFTSYRNLVLNVVTTITLP